VADTYHESVMDAAKAIVAAEALPDIPAERVYKRLTTDRVKLTFPCVVVSIEGCNEEWRPLDTENDVLTLPVNVALAHRLDLRADDPLLARWLAWRQGLRRAFLMRLMGDVDEVWHVEVKPMATLDAQRVIGPEYQGGAAGLILEPQVVVARRRD